MSPKLSWGEMYREHAKFGLGAQSINLTSLNIYTDKLYELNAARGAFSPFLSYEAAVGVLVLNLVQLFHNLLQ